MNDEVKKALNKLEELVNKIIADCECILSDIEDTEESMDMFTIEAGFERIERTASDGYKKAQATWDLFDEED